jgi:hypothetical protein
LRGAFNDTRSHGEEAGIDAARIQAAIAAILNERAFLSRLRLPKTLDKIWRKAFKTPGKDKPDYLPRFALA